MTSPRLPASRFQQIQEEDRRCGDCTVAEQLGFDFAYAYQPVVDVATRGIWGHEALVRGPAGEGADTVLSRVDDTNRYRFDQACRVRALDEAARLGIRERVSINFMPNAIYRPEVCIGATLRAARANDIPLDRIVLEVTEGERVEDGGWLMEILREYRRLGLTTAIDDFGAGYAGLSLLADFQPDVVKVDMGLVRGVAASRSRQAIVRGLLRTCEELDILVIAEGVETADERDFLRDAGVRLMQGWWFARPAFRAIATVPPHAWP